MEIKQSIMEREWVRMVKPGLGGVDICAENLRDVRVEPSEKIRGRGTLAEGKDNAGILGGKGLLCPRRLECLERSE